MQLIKHGIGGIKRAHFKLNFFCIQDVHVGEPVKHKIKMFGLKVIPDHL